MEPLESKFASNDGLFTNKQKRWGKCLTIRVLRTNYTRVLCLKRNIIISVSYRSNKMPQLVQKDFELIDMPLLWMDLLFNLFILKLTMYLAHTWAYEKKWNCSMNYLKTTMVFWMKLLAAQKVCWDKKGAEIITFLKSPSL